MAYTTIDKPTDYFDTLTYTGNGNTNQEVNGLNFTPSYIWIKGRDTAHPHTNIDSVRGGNKYLKSNETGVEETDPQYGWIDSFDSDGFTTQIGSNSTPWNVNKNGETYVAWCWRTGTSFTNDASSTGVGTIDSSGSVNQDAGFSIVSFDLSGQSGNETIKHGLNTAPKVVITKRRSGGAGDWTSYFGAIGNTYLVLSSTNAGATSTSFMNNTAPTSSVFTVGDPSWWGANPFIAYCFAEKKGYSKFGSYIGNGNADGAFVYCGFRPAWVMIKRDGSGENWTIRDNKRDVSNVMTRALKPNLNAADGTGDGSEFSADFLSNGFKLRAASGHSNSSGQTNIFMAFAESPFVNSKSVPNNAR